MINIWNVIYLSLYTCSYMTGAPKQFDKDRVLAKALDQFWSCGYEATSMQDLVDAMGINRASLYTTFGNKQELFSQAFDCYCARSIAYIETILQASDSELNNLEQFFSFLTSTQGDRVNFGCFANNVAVELGPHDSEIAQKVRLFWEQIQRALSKTLARAVEKQELAAATDVASLSSLLNVAMQGLSALSKAGVNPKQSRDAVKQLLVLLPRS